MITEKTTQREDAQFKENGINGELNNFSCKKGSDHVE
jgi:hypothetical protein